MLPVPAVALKAQPADNALGSAEGGDRFGHQKPTPSSSSPSEDRAAGPLVGAGGRVLRFPSIRFGSVSLSKGNAKTLCPKKWTQISGREHDDVRDGHNPQLADSFL